MNYIEVSVLLLQRFLSVPSRSKRMPRPRSFDGFPLSASNVVMLRLLLLLLMMMMSSTRSTYMVYGGRSYDLIN